MPENPIPAAKPSSAAAPGEFNFVQPTEENPRIRRRSLKAKPGGLIKPASPAPMAKQELEREAPSLSTEQAKARVVEPSAAKTASTAIAPPRTTPSVSPAAIRFAAGPGQRGAQDGRSPRHDNRAARHHQRRPQNDGARPCGVGSELPLFRRHNRFDFDHHAFHPLHGNPRPPRRTARGRRLSTTAPNLEKIRKPLP